MNCWSPRKLVCFEKDYLHKKFKCDPKKKTIVWLPTWKNLSSVDKYLKSIESFKLNYNIIIKPHPSMKDNDPEMVENINKLKNQILYNN